MLYMVTVNNHGETNVLNSCNLPLGVIPGPIGVVSLCGLNHNSVPVPS